MKKMFSLALALIMALALSVPAFAADVTVQGAVDDETYNAYKVFDYTKSGENFAYTIASDSQWKDDVDAYAVGDQDVFTLTASATDPTTLVVTINDGVSFSDETAAKAFAEYLMSKIAGKTADQTVVAEKGEAKFTDLDAGYYFMDTSLGALCALMNADTDQVMMEKNAVPTIDKKIVENKGENDEELVEKTNTSISKFVDYRITVTDGKGTDSAITVHDQMEAGLSLKSDSFVITTDKGEVDASNYKIKTQNLKDGCTFEVIFNDAYVASIEEGTKIYIDYYAKLNQFAEIAEESNDNTAWLTYSEQESKKITVEVYTYKFDLVKTDEAGAELAGASFKLYDAETDGNVICLSDMGNNTYRVSDIAGDDATIVAGKVVIEGLGNGTYYLEEIAAPDGYNLLTARVAVTIEDDNLLYADADEDGVYEEGEGGVIVVNQTGIELPSTGGVGTTIFYVVGGLMMAAAGILLVTKKKVANEEE